MATVKKLIGRLPVYKGDWVAGTYSMLNQVSYLGSTFQSKIDNNTSQPATLVNNVLQVNSNWSVVSNGTAAYVANDRLTACETASTYAQDGVDTLRSDVQGVISSKPIVCKIGDMYNTSWSMEYYGTIETNDERHILSLASTRDSAQNPVIELYSYPKIRFRNKSQYSSYINYNIGEPVHIVYTHDAITHDFKVYYNGVLWASTIINSFRLGDGVCLNALYSAQPSSSRSKIAKSRVFNRVLTQQQIDALYNQGRCNEVVFGDEWRSRMMSLDFKDYSLWSLSGGATYNDATKEFSIITSGDSAGILPTYNTTTTSDNSALTLKTDQISMIEFEAKGSGDIKAVSGGNAIFLIGQYRITLTNDWVRYMVAVKGNGTDNSITLVSYGGVLNATIRNVVISNPKLLNEYTPKYLTKTKWIDSGVNKQDIALTSPTFSYVKPYKDVEFAEGVPTTPPVASGCMRIDRTNKRAYLSILK